MADESKKATYDSKIDRLNALRQLLETSLPLKKNVNDELKAQLQDEFKRWISGLIEDALGRVKDTDKQNNVAQFSQEDMEVVRAFVDQIKSRTQGARTPNTVPLPPNKNARPMREDPRKPKDMNNQILDELEKMEREASKKYPEY